MKKRNYIISYIIVLCTVLLSVGASDAFADKQSEFQEFYHNGTTIETTTSDACDLLTDEEKEKNPACATYNKTAFDLAQEIINIILGIVGVAAVIVIIIAGIMMSTSAGNSGKVQKAKTAVIYAIIGLAIAVSAALIINFVLDGVFA